MATITFSNVTKTYGQNHVVDNLDLDLPDGSMTVLVGPSGCGKSTSLRMLAGLEAVSSGDIFIGERNVTHVDTRDRDIAMVFQNYALYPHLDVLDNVAFPLRAKKMKKADAHRRATEVAQSVGLGELLKRRPKDLSGGQQQRVAIARAIVREPAIFLFDEPLSNLDAKLRIETRTELLRIQRRLGITSFYVTHDQEEAMTLSDRMVVTRNGGVAQTGTPNEVYSRPVDTFVATFVGSPKMNLIAGSYSESLLHTEIGIDFAVDPPRRGDLLLGVRPDDLLLSPDPASHAVVSLVELLGPRAIVTVTAGATELTAVAEVSRLGGIESGAPVALRVRPRSAHYFDRESGNRIE
ncbi:ABC transporter ATP-binding protein [Mycolicibacterium sarraceniae]|uniref:Trehalose import ATP-binding protein SugC n=1 Tax=Mycolicibacterium sarraceniae TaxID=1534348 RepID=A0A7I7SYY4_9MYCO|nr:ATP-binding cassette domain-containing protein [Mycolicibacterium sarraceniae]BBY61399.1 sugar ABC transporter ATP-binding protein [Mycolicibacterium sarraceniae]